MTCPDCDTAVEPSATECPVCAADLSHVDATTVATGDASVDEDEWISAPAMAGSLSDDEPPPAAPSSTPAPHVPPPPRAVIAPTAAIMHPSGLSSDVRTWGMAAHLSSLVFGFVGPLVVWLVKREEHPFLDHHGREALNFNLSLTLYSIVGVVLGFVTFFLGFIVIIPALIVMGIAAFVLTIIAAVKANNGEGYRYPLSIRFLRQ